MVNPWMEHVAEIREKYPDLSYKEALIKAGESYKPKKTTKKK